MVCENFLNVHMPKQRGEKLAVGRGPLAAGAPSNGTTGTIINPALIKSATKFLYVKTSSGRVVVQPSLYNGV